MTLEEMQAVIDQIEYKGWRFFFCASTEHGLYLQASWVDDCTASGTTRVQKSRKWLLSQHMTKSEIVQTALKCVLAAEEHEARERFTYKGQRIFGPHFSVDTLVEIARCGTRVLDYRKEPAGTK